jgi:hypothetical protein
MRAKFGRMIMCHMIGTDETEMHAMAQRIGVRCKWYQGDHYDICLEMRARAVEYGAIEITWRQAGCMHMRRRITGKMGLPRDAERWVKQHIARRRAVVGR